MVKMRLSLFIAVFVSGAAVFGQDAGEQWRALRQRYLGLRSLAGSFTEELTPEAGDRIVFEGKFFFQLPKRFRLEVSKPTRQLIVGSDSVVWFYFPEEKRAVCQTRSQGFPLLAFLEPLLDTTSHIREETTGSGRRVVRIQPAGEALLSDLVLELDATGTRVVGFSFVDDWGNHCHFVLTDQRWNPSLASKLFRWRPPAGTKIEFQ